MWPVLALLAVRITLDTMNISVIIITLLINIDSIKWKIVSETGPPTRYINTMVCAENSLLLFGGKNGNNKGFNDLWEWRDGSWNPLGNWGIKRWDHSYVYMKNKDQLFLFGGRTFKVIQGKEERVDLNDNWFYKNRKWKKLEIESPPPRSSHSIVFCQNSNLAILFGGRNKDDIFNDTWSFDGKKWSKLTITGPTKRYGHALSYDPISEKVYLFGGFDGEKLLNDFWVFNGTKWTEIETKIKPSPRIAHAMQFDNDGNACAILGDGLIFVSIKVAGNLWIWTNGEWVYFNTEKMPEGRLSCAIGYDSAHNEFILFGGSTGFDGKFLPETWRLSLTKDQ